MLLKTMLWIVLLPTGVLSSAQPAKAVPTSGYFDLGGAQPEQKPSTPPPADPKKIRARISPNGKATISADAPSVVRRVIQAGNQIVGKPYVYGGGHASFYSSGYDCSGTVSFALRGGRLLSSPMASGGLAGWGRSGSGKWITVFANGGHAFMHVAGIRLDTSAAGDSRGGKGPRWRPVLRSTAGYTSRHPRGL